MTQCARCRTATAVTRGYCGDCAMALHRRGELPPPDTSESPRGRARRKARAARNGAILGAAGLMFGGLGAVTGAWGFYLTAVALLVFAVAAFRRAVILARPLPESDDAETFAALTKSADSVSLAFRPDRTSDAADVLRAKGTPFAAELANEIERGQRYRRREATLAHDMMRDEHEREYATKKAARDRMARSLRKADPGEYACFLDKWTRAGKSIRHYDRPMNSDRVMVATSRMHVEPLHGALSFGVILVPPGIEVTGSEPGHTDVVWTDLSRSMTFHGGPVRNLPAYSDAHPALAL